MRKRGFLGHIFTVGAFIMLSRVLGLVREMLQSRLIGAGVEQSAFTLAFAIPNMARKLFGEGALTAAFVPIFREEVDTVGIEKAARLARAVMTMVLLLLGAAVILALSGILSVLTIRDFSLFAFHVSLSDRATLSLGLIAILMPYMLAICGAAFGMGVLNALGRFKASSFMPALLNIIWIAALAALALFPGLSIVARVRFVAAAILVGGFAQMAFMFVCMARAGVKPYPLFSGWRTERVRLVWHNLAIAAAGAGAVQVNYMLDQVLGQLAAPWAAGVIGYAERLMDLPLGVIGVAFGTVLLPTFAGFFAKNDAEGAREAMAISVRNMMYVMIPAAAGLCVLAPEVTRVIYQGGSFDAVATTRVSRALAVYAVGLGFFGLQKSLIPWFQAQKDMGTPLRVSLVTVIVNATLNILAVWLLPEEWRHVGLAASTVLCAFLGCVLLLRAARVTSVRAVPSRPDSTFSLHLFSPSLLFYLFRVLLASLAMATVLVFVRPFASLPPILNLAALIVEGLLVYGILSLFLRIFRLPRTLFRSH